MSEEEIRETLVQQGKEISESMKDKSYDPPKTVKSLVDAFNEDQSCIANAIHTVLREVERLDNEDPKPSLTGLGQVIKDVETLVKHTTITYIPTPHVRISKADMILNVWYIGYEADRIVQS